MTLPDPYETPGRWLITPIQFQWMENGYFWGTTQKWDRHHILVNPSARSFKKKYKIYWFQDSVTLHNYGIQTLMQDNPCKCKECIDGRKKVRKGWKPKIDEFGYSI